MKELKKKQYFCLSANTRQEILYFDIEKAFGSEFTSTHFLNAYRLEADYVIGVLKTLGYKLLNVSSTEQNVTTHYFHFIQDDSHDKRE